MDSNSEDNCVFTTKLLAISVNAITDPITSPVIYSWCLRGLMYLVGTVFILVPLALILRS
jgi:hypothetical protein